ncbi:glucose-6-phosphate isomerase family protein [Salipaludibacillus aurantiacus]|uniref:glucose-6-phosphate isomerase n=1 Tax=Salipaludibacillus aurantiacus TaxID=1601833 RepID=A0A1H9UQW9_9BACI|nr:glucose-6-phosphate isomerase family protein [Salipaludibacillus aurantiacus]SES11786.1 glucose-6-phosphate isomerase [Salipaludibacillus aurantiacus]
MEIKDPRNHFSKENGALSGEKTSKTIRKLKDMKGFYEDEEAFNKMDPETVLYEVEMHAPVKAGTEGGLFFGTSFLNPGKVGEEFFMTKGHFHEIINRAEYYWGLEGEGVLVFMDEDGNASAEKVCPGSLHFVPGKIAHRLVNTGDTKLAVGACWPADAGHQYGPIAESGFGVRIKEKNGTIIAE